jgi:hypothetical protein
MSLTTLTKEDAQARGILDLILPTEKVVFGKPLVFPGLTTNAAVVGTAFDYLMRFEMERRFQDVKASIWVAQVVIVRLRAHFRDAATSSMPFPARGATMDEAMARRWMTLVVEARDAVSAYAKLPKPTRTDQVAIAHHALTLARIDVLHRARYVDEKVGIEAPEDAEDCVRLLEAVPWHELVSGSPVVLNPTFGQASKRVGGADADVICGSRLIDFKATKTVAPRETLRQLLGYLILAREARRDDSAFPEITELVAYYARHRHVEVVPTVRFTSHPRFEEVCRLFLERADELGGVRAAFGDTMNDDADMPSVRSPVATSPRQVTKKASKSPEPSAPRRKPGARVAQRGNKASRKGRAR